MVSLPITNCGLERCFIMRNGKGESKVGSRAEPEPMRRPAAHTLSAPHSTASLLPRSQAHVWPPPLLLQGYGFVEFAQPSTCSAVKKHLETQQRQVRRVLRAVCAGLLQCLAPLHCIPEGGSQVLHVWV